MDDLRVHPDLDHDDVVDTHYAALERLECSWCFGGMVTITVERDGEEHDVAVPCTRCAS